MPKEHAEGERTERTPNRMEATPPAQECSGLKGAPVEPRVEQARVGRQNDDEREGDHRAQQQAADQGGRSASPQPGHQRRRQANGRERGLQALCAELVERSVP